MTSYNKKGMLLLALSFLAPIILAPSNAFAGFDSLTFKPAADQGFYLTTQQSKTLGTMGFAIGLSGDYSSNSLELKNNAGNKIQNVIQKQVGLNLGAALGIAPWLDVGVDVAGVPYQQFVTPGTLARDNGAHFGDIMVDLKARIIDSEKSGIGLALVPFITFPTGSDSHFVGEDTITGGGKLVVDTKRIGDRVSFALNAGGQVRDDIQLSPGAARMSDQFLYGAAANVELAKPVQLIAEVSGSTPFNNFFNDNNNNLEVDGAIRFLPGENRNLQITAGGGAGLMQQAGVPDYRIFTTLALRFPKEKVVVARIAQPEPVREIVISTNDIHFAFDKATIHPSSYPLLDKIFHDIQSQSEVKSVRVEGHTDNIGSDDYNQKLSVNRANSIRTYLINKGYDADQIVAVGMGETNPIDDNTTSNGRAHNRRVEFHLQIPVDSNVSTERSKVETPVYE